jgi:hypothetical protein
MTGSRLSRRAVLRGLGVTMALPALEIMDPRKAMAQDKPLRFMTVYSPNGFVMDKWKPTGMGTTWEVPPLLSSLAPYKGDFSMVTGLGSYPASLTTAFGGSHTRACGSLLTQYPVGYKSDGVMNGISLDQMIANQIKDKTKFPSLQLGGKANSAGGNCEDQFSCAYNNNISWSGPTTFLPKQVNPRDVFNRLFMDGGAAPMPTMPGKPDNRPLFQKSILDVVRTRADALRMKLGKTDKQKVDEYFNSVREVEQRIERTIGSGGMTEPKPAVCTMPGTPPPEVRGTEIPYKDHLDLLSDLIALSFQCDLTRVATYMFEHSFSNTRSFSFIGVSGRHHEITHVMGAEARAQEEKIDRFYIERFAYLMGKLKAMKEGDATVLDNSIIYFTSEFGDAGKHAFRDLPMVIAGNAGGKLKKGVHVKYELAAGMGEGIDGYGHRADTQLASLHLATLQCFGMQKPSYGSDDKGVPIATKALTDILA